MKFLIVLACLAAVAMSSPLSAEKLRLRILPAVKHEEIHDKFGQYSIRYVTAEGTIVSERGRLVPTPDNSDYVLVIEGEYTFIDDEGKPVVTKYSSGLDGFKAEGAHLSIPATPVV